MVDQKKYQKMFIRESQENLEILNNSLLKLEKKPNDKKSATELMRAAHTLKSSAAAMGYMQMSQLAHAIEDIFDQIRAGKSQFSPKNSNTLFNTFDLIDKSLQVIKNNQPELDTSAVIENLHKLRGSNADLLRGSERGSPNQSELGTGQADQREISVEDQREDLRGSEAEGRALAERPETLRPLEEIKVDIKTLDSLMSLAEELLVNKMRLTEVVKSKKYEELPVALDMLGRLVTDTQYNIMQARMVPLGQIFDRFPRMVRDLANKENKEVDFEVEGGDIELDRTVIDKIGEPLVHLLRNAVDHGIGTKGKVQLKAKREKSYVLIEVINEGNAIDWQAVVEAAVRRGIINKMKGEEYLKEIGNWKTCPELAEGLEIENLLYHPQLSTSTKVTETSGRGIGLNIVKTRIESLGGTVSVESPAFVPQSETTAGKPLTKQEGGLPPEALAKGGTKFTLRLPLTIAIIQALLIKVGEEIFAIPITNIDRSVKVQPDSIKKALDREVAIVDGVDIPLVRLNKLFDLSKAVASDNGSADQSRISDADQHADQRLDQRSESASRSALVVIIKKTILLESGKEEERPILGLLVDGLVSEQEIVIKPLTGILKQNKGFAGITILGDGRPALILDVTNLI